MQNLGYKVQVACNFHKGNTCDKKEIIALKTKLREMKVEFYDVNFYRDVTNISENIIAYKQLKEIFRRNHYEIVHCHTPIGGVLARIIANKYRNKNAKVLYTAHGFHFYKGAPLKNWLLYFPVEWILSFSTDILITINKEDFALAKRCMRAKKVKYIPGVGIDRSKYSCNSLTNMEKRKIRNDIGINNDEIMLLSVGELSTRKNHEIVIKAIHKLNNKRIKYYICGQGDLENHLQSLINSFNLNENVQLLGLEQT